MSSKFSILIFAAMVIMFSCTSDENDTSPVNDCTTSKPTYTVNIASIMNASCALAGCHSASSKSAGFDLSNYTTTKSAAANSKFLKSIKHESGVSRMPEGGSKLPDSTIKLIECWISNGTPQ